MKPHIQNVHLSDSPLGLSLPQWTVKNGKVEATEYSFLLEK